MTGKPDDPFFVGYARKVPRAITTFALWAAAALAGILLAEAVILPLSAADPGSGRYANDLRGATLTGMIEAAPYPMLRVAPEAGKPARALLLGGRTKIGVQGQIAALPLGAVEVGGVFVRRGDIEMLLVGGAGIRLSEQPDAAFVPAPSEDLGRWRLTGEICDGKCYAGVMRPGTGLAHKACANLCVQGGLPPVLVMELPVEGSTVVVLADHDGGPMPEAMFDLVAIPVQMEGRLERRDDLLIFRVDPRSVSAL